MAKKLRHKASKDLTERVNLRLTAEEYALLEAARRQDERSLSNWARRALVKEAKRQLEQESR